MPNKKVAKANKRVAQAKGRAKEAAGVLTGDRRLKYEGRIDQAKASIMSAVDTVFETLADGPKRKKAKNKKPAGKKPKGKRTTGTK
jgi:uncharacterized protein YjbJ (UPF0337 family)